MHRRVVVFSLIVAVVGIMGIGPARHGPPDRQPQAKRKEEVVRDGGRGRARDYLEETAASRMLVP
jgi:hypothetical protein